MPELPEVETIRSTLAPLLVGKRIADVKLFLPKALRGATPGELLQALAGCRIEGVGRRGKHLLLFLSGGLRLIFHLRMTGRLIVKEIGEPLAKHTTLVLTLDGGEQLRFEDTRKFGTVDLLRNDTPHAVDALGPEPLSGWTAEEFIRSAGRRRTAIKGILLNQQIVAGLGNIYADEALFRAGIHPEQPAFTLKKEDWLRLHGAVREVLAEAIRFRGTTHRDYVDGKGSAGSFQERLQVYGRGGLPCPNCGGTINRRRVAGRSSHFCPNCQPKREGGTE